MIKQSTLLPDIGLAEQIDSAIHEMYYLILKSRSGLA
jgi:hypothetical protein